jgi:hypothetical protein
MAHVHDHATTRDGGALTVFVASADLLARLSSQSASADLLTFTDSESQGALDAIVRRRPRVVVLEQLFAATAKGEAFVNRLRADPQLSGLEIRLLASDRSAVLKTSPHALNVGGGTLVSMAQPFLTGPLRRAQRVRMPAGVDLVIDGSAARLIDLSTMGAQVLSAVILRPNQSVRLSLPEPQGMVKVVAGVAWSAMELRHAARYRAGIEFKDAHPELLAALTDALSVT